MDWYHANHRQKNGAVDRKAELDGVWGDHYEVLKSAMVGSTYYAAVKVKETGKVFAAVFLTKVNSRETCNFGYKDMEESMGPNEAKCPLSILNLLTKTDNEIALEWRARCRKYHADKNSPASFENLPLGTKIVWTVPYDRIGNFCKGMKLELIKTKFGKRTIRWVTADGSVGFDPKNVQAEHAEVVETP